MLTCIEHETSPNPLASVIWMHGLGADGSDFAGIVPQLNLRHCPPIRFVFPNAPSMPVTVNNGYVMPAWYDIYAVIWSKNRMLPVSHAPPKLFAN